MPDYYYTLSGRKHHLRDRGEGAEEALNKAERLFGEGGQLLALPCPQCSSPKNKHSRTIEVPHEGGVGTGK